MLSAIKLKERQVNTPVSRATAVAQTFPLGLPRPGLGIGSSPGPATVYRQPHGSRLLREVEREPRAVWLVNCSHVKDRVGWSWW